jgi:hypothetical protein
MRPNILHCVALLSASIVSVGSLGRYVLLPSVASRVSLQQGNVPALLRAQRAIGTSGLTVRSLTLKGTCVSGFDGITAEPNTEPSDVEFWMLLPDHWVRIDRGPVSESYKGFAFDQALYGARAVSPEARVAPAATPPPTFLSRRRAEAACLLLGVLADARRVLAIQSVSSGVDSNPNTILLTGPDGFSAVLELDPTTALPVRLRCVERVGFVQPLTPTEIRGRVAPRGLKWEDAEVTTTFDDRRPVNGLQLPHHVSRSARGVTLEDIRFRQMIVNGPMTSGDFRRFGTSR